MIETAAGQPFEAVLEGAPTGLMGTVAVRVVSTPAGAVIVPRSTAGITEAAPGVYVVELEVPTNTADPSLLIVWDLGDPADPAETFTEELRLTGIVAAPVVTGPDGGVVLDATAVRLETAGLMAFRLRQSGFVAGQGGAETTDFTAATTPNLVTAQRVTERNAALVSDDFPGADAGDEPELRTIAALRSAIELEASAPTMDEARIRAWRDQLREYVKRVTDTGGDGPAPGEPGARVLDPVWSFGPAEDVRVEGSEGPQPVYYFRPYTAPVPPEGDRPRRLQW